VSALIIAAILGVWLRERHLQREWKNRMRDMRDEALRRL
jgi:hypothetical protein